MAANYSNLKPGVARAVTVSFRTPLLHDGCAATLSDRFGACGGGGQHGHTSPLRRTELADLIAYLEML